MLKRGHGVQGFPLSQRPLLNEMKKVGKCALRGKHDSIGSLEFQFKRTYA